MKDTKGRQLTIITNPSIPWHKIVLCIIKSLTLILVFTLPPEDCVSALKELCTGRFYSVSNIYSDNG